MFNCKKLFKLQIRPPSLILLITASQDRGIFPSQSWEVRNSIIIIIIIIIIISFLSSDLFREDLFDIKNPFLSPHVYFMCLVKVCLPRCFALKYQITFVFSPFLGMGA